MIFLPVYIVNNTIINTIIAMALNGLIFLWLIKGHILYALSIIIIGPEVELLHEEDLYARSELTLLLILIFFPLIIILIFVYRNYRFPGWSSRWECICLIRSKLYKILLGFIHSSLRMSCKLPFQRFNFWGVKYTSIINYLKYGLNLWLYWVDYTASYPK